MGQKVHPNGIRLGICKLGIPLGLLTAKISLTT